MNKEMKNDFAAASDLDATESISATPPGCEGCLAATSGFYCDLGAKTVVVWKEQRQVGARPLGRCPRPEQREDYLVEHLKRI